MQTEIKNKAEVLAEMAVRAKELGLVSVWVKDKPDMYDHENEWVKSFRKSCPVVFGGYADQYEGRMIVGTIVRKNLVKGFVVISDGQTSFRLELREMKEFGAYVVSRQKAIDTESLAARIKRRERDAAAKPVCRTAGDAARDKHAAATAALAAPKYPKFTTDLGAIIELRPHDLQAQLEFQYDKIMLALKTALGANTPDEYRILAADAYRAYYEIERLALKMNVAFMVAAESHSVDSRFSNMPDKMAKQALRVQRALEVLAEVRGEVE